MRITGSRPESKWLMIFQDSHVLLPTILVIGALSHGKIQISDLELHKEAMAPTSLKLIKIAIEKKANLKMASHSFELLSSISTHQEALSLVCLDAVHFNKMDVRLDSRISRLPMDLHLIIQHDHQIKSYLKLAI